MSQHKHTRKTASTSQTVSAAVCLRATQTQAGVLPKPEERGSTVRIQKRLARSPRLLFPKPQR
ncbi:hypothetical protein E2C01_046436 [Portunus trituberculatus]|uniref:Uncharacterized protein n=1 Tax=Portunus trituberculatus TaxID=210409 RepID=A0A5B7G561_PORTR|nr:hypothetical protein [Portunus trituberculatus]